MNNETNILNLKLTKPEAQVLWAKFDRLTEENMRLSAKVERQDKSIQELKELVKVLISEHNKPKPFYTIEDLMLILGVSENTIMKYRRVGLLECCSYEQKVWFTQEHIDDFMRKTDSRFKIKPIIATRKRIEKQKNFEIK